MLKSVVVGLVKQIAEVFTVEDESLLPADLNIDDLTAKEVEGILAQQIQELVQFVVDSPDEESAGDVTSGYTPETNDISVHEYVSALEEEVANLKEQNVKMKAIAMEALFKLRQTIDENGAVVEVPRVVIETNIKPFDAFVQRMGLNNRVSPQWKTVQIQQQADRFTVLFPHEVYTDPLQKDACVGFLNRLERHAKNKGFPVNWHPKGYLIIIGRRPPQREPRSSDI